jgi:hypothetical protein
MLFWLYANSFTPVLIKQVSKVQDVKTDLKGISLPANVNKELLHDLGINSVSPWENCTVALSIHSLAAAQVFILIDICKECITLLLSCPDNTIGV